MVEENKVYGDEILFKFLEENNLSTNIAYYSDDELSMLRKEAEKNEKEVEEKMKRENRKRMMNLLIKRKVINRLRIPGEYITPKGINDFRIIGSFDPERYLIENGFDPKCMYIKDRCFDIATNDLVCFIKMMN